MAGHSKWANIRHRKGRADAAKAKIYSKLGREITVAAKMGGGNPDMNPRLRLALLTARSQSMSKDAIERAIAKGIGAGATEDYFTVRYEGYGPGGVAIIVETLTDNRNRTAGEVRSIFTRYGGNMGETGSVGFMFDRIGEIVYPLAKGSAEAMFEAAVEAGANDADTDEAFHYISCAPDDFAAVREALVSKFGEPERSGLIWSPNVMSPQGEEGAATILKLVEALEDDDDVQNVTTNMEVSDEIMLKLVG